MNISKFLMAVFVISFSAASTSAENYFSDDRFSGNEMLLACENKQNPYHDYCLGFVFGTISTLLAVENFSNIDICFERGVTTNQVVSIFSKWAEKNPERLHLPAARLLVVSLVGVFPCPSAN